MCRATAGGPSPPLILLLMIWPQLCHATLGPVTEEHKSTLLEVLGLDSEPIVESRPVVPKFMKGLYRAYEYLTPGNAHLHGQDIQAKSADIGMVSSRHVLDMTFPLSVAVGNVAQLTLVMQRRPGAKYLSDRQSNALVCEKALDLCQLVAGRRYQAVGASTAWDLFDLSFLLQAWNKSGVSTVPSVNLNLKLTELTTNLGDDYRLLGPHRPLLVSWRRPETWETLQHIRAPARRRRHAVLANQTADSTICHLRPWRISFADIGWDQWIIEPTGYTPNYCSGPCNNILDDPSQVATSNAYMRFAARQKHPESAMPAVTCGTLSLEPLAVIYFKDNITVSIRLQNMIATRCGCL